MSEEPKRRYVGEPITDPTEWAGIKARQTPDDGGAERMVGAALEIAEYREARGKPVDLLGAVLGLAGQLTQEQRGELVRRLSVVPDASPATA